MSASNLPTPNGFIRVGDFPIKAGKPPYTNVMRQINTEQITKKIKKLCIDANYNLGNDLINSLRNALEKEESPLGKEVITQLLENAEIGRKEQAPVCQDTGFAIVFIEIGQEVVLTGGDLREAINEGIRRGYRNGLLRK